MKNGRLGMQNMDQLRDLLSLILFVLCLGILGALLVFINELHKHWVSQQLDKAIMRAISNGQYRNSYRYRPRKAKS
jgi:hypothetical protein